MSPLAPPFKLAVPARAVPVVSPWPDCDHEHGGASASDAPDRAGARRRLVDLDGALHCSVIGTCLGTGELRRVLARHLPYADFDDVEVHHEAVALVAERGAAAKALQKALDHRHAVAIGAASRVRGAPALLAHWKAALGHGEVPGAYWAVLTHRDATSDLIRRVFGDVHMLSHLVGASNRADLRRLVALEAENAAAKRELAASHERAHLARAAHARAVAALEAALVATRDDARRADASRATGADVDARIASLIDDAALHRSRGVRWERAALDARAESARLRDALAALGRQMAALEGELALVDPRTGHVDADADGLAERVRGRRILYVGGRPGASQAIRDLVLRHGGAYRAHDGGLEDRKGLLAAAVGASDVVLFPVDCIDHDSAGTIKRLCARHGVPFVPLRSAGVASFVVALRAAPPVTDERPSAAAG